MAFLSLSLSLSLSEGKVTIPSPMKPVGLYRHLLAHSNIFGTQTIELTVGGAATSDLRPETIGLLINVSPQFLGPTTTPELSKIIEETQVKCSNLKEIIIRLLVPRIPYSLKFFKVENFHGFRRSENGCYKFLLRNFKLNTDTRCGWKLDRKNFIHENLF